MAFSWAVLSDEELEAQKKRLEPGTYDFEVINAEEDPKNGVPRIKLQLKVWDHTGREHTILDWLSGASNMSWKIKQFWESVGHPDVYQSSSVDLHSFIGYCGIAEVTEYENKKDGKKYINVGSYVKAKTEKKTVADKTPDFNDDIPF